MHKTLQRSLCTPVITRILQQAALCAGLGHVTAHMPQRGADIQHIQELLGHSSRPACGIVIKGFALADGLAQSSGSRADVVTNYSGIVSEEIPYTS